MYLLLIILVEKRKTGEHLAAKVVSISLYCMLGTIAPLLKISEHLLIILLGKSSKASEAYHALLGE